MLLHSIVLFITVFKKKLLQKSNRPAFSLDVSLNLEKFLIMRSTLTLLYFMWSTAPYVLEGSLQLRTLKTTIPA